MRNALKAGIGLVSVGLLWFGIGAGTAAAQQLSDETARAYMSRAWAGMPAKFTDEDGKTIEIDLKKPAENQVSLNIAKEIIIVAQRSARAQVCELPAEQAANLRALRRRLESYRLTPQQMVYSRMLHLMVVQLLIPEVARAIYEDEKGNKEIVNLKPTAKCNDDERVRVRNAVQAFVAANPPAPPAPTQTGSTVPAATPAKK